jgi:hypothetical protein
LLIPQARGTTFRITFSTLLIALAAWVVVITLQGIHSGILIWPSHYEPHIRIDRVTRPEAFWIAAIVWFAICVWLIYASVAEILYATREHEQR